VLSGSQTVKRQIDELCSGSTRDFLNHEILLSVNLPLPNIAEQKSIVSRVTEAASILDAVANSLGTNLRRAARLRQAILEKAFRGELVPQDPNDEPASALLERIRAQRAAEAESSGKRIRKARVKEAPAG
jgi:type I restriction enzyme S subunit